MANDITRIKDLEHCASRIRSLFFSSVAHELRTPLNTIIPMAGCLYPHVNTDKGRFLLKIITNASKHLQHVVEDALDMSRIENNKFQINLEKFNLKEVL
jgi:two-component system sensor histidine kinase/response regulator